MKFSRQELGNIGVGCLALLQGIFPTQDWTQVSHITDGFFAFWTTKEAQEYWSGQPISSPGDLLDPGIKPGSPVLQILYQLSYPGNQDICIHIADSLHCTAETDTILQSNYTPRNKTKNLFNTSETAVSFAKTNIKYSYINNWKTFNSTHHLSSWKLYCFDSFLPRWPLFSSHLPYLQLHHSFRLCSFSSSLSSLCSI